MLVKVTGKPDAVAKLLSELEASASTVLISLDSEEKLVKLVSMATQLGLTVIINPPLAAHPTTLDTPAAPPSPATTAPQPGGRAQVAEDSQKPAVAEENNDSLLMKYKMKMRKKTRTEEQPARGEEPGEPEKAETGTGAEPQPAPPPEAPSTTPIAVQQQALPEATANVEDAEADADFFYELTQKLSKVYQRRIVG